MAYQDHFRLADELVTHLNGVIAGLANAFIETRYVGFVAVTGTTVYELAIKDILVSFAEAKHRVFGAFAGAYFDRLNGRIKTRDLKDNLIARFGDKYVKQYQKLLQDAESNSLKTRKISILSAYNNLIEWRHQFAHEGKVPTTANYAEVTKSYDAGKEVIHCLYRAMRR